MGDGCRFQPLIFQGVSNHPHVFGRWNQPPPRSQAWRAKSGELIDSTETCVSCCVWRDPVTVMRLREWFESVTVGGRINVLTWILLSNVFFLKMMVSLGKWSNLVNKKIWLNCLLEISLDFNDFVGKAPSVFFLGGWRTLIDCRF